MKKFSSAISPGAYTQSFAAALTVASILGVAAGSKTARAWDQQPSASAHWDQRETGEQRDFQFEGR